MPRAVVHRWRERIWLLLCCIGLPLLVLLHVGQDSNWDLQNYHLYNPYAWLHGRLASDIAPAQMQSWHNPLLDTPLYLMAQAGLPGWVTSLWLTLPFMLALYFLLRVYRLFSPQPDSRLSWLVLGVVGLSGAATYSEIGTSLNDGFVAAGISGALLLLLAASPSNTRAWFFAGLIGGATAGLKLTAVMYCAALAIAALAATPLRSSPKRLAALLLGGLLGSILTYGYWGWTLEQLHGNPVFPYFNQWFRSPDALPIAHADERFRPGSIADALLVPLRLLVDNHRYSELDLRDPRLLLGMIGFLVLLCRPRLAAEDPATGHRVRMLAAFFFASIALWLYQYGIYRYALPLEMLAVLPVIVLLQRLPGAWAPISLLAMGALVLAATIQPDWGRQHFGESQARIAMPALPKGSLVVLSSQEPVAYAVTALPDDVPAVSIYNNFMLPNRCTHLQARAEQMIGQATGPLWLLRTPSKADDNGQKLADDYYGLSVNGPCREIASNLGGLRLCPLRHDPRRRWCASPAPATGR